MATRFYLPSGGVVPGVTPAYSSFWTGFATDVRRELMDTTKAQNTALTESHGQGIMSFPLYGGPDSGLLMRQYISNPLNPQTVSGSITAVVIGHLLGGTNIPYTFNLVGRVMSSDGLTTRGTFAASRSPTPGWWVRDAAQATRLLNWTLTSVTAQADDILVLEIGQIHQEDNSSAGGNGYMIFGDDAGTADYAFTDGLTTVLDPWVEFSADLDIQTPASGPSEDVYPDADIQTGAWLTAAGGTTNLYQQVDEPTTPSDADYVKFTQ